MPTNLCHECYALVTSSMCTDERNSMTGCSSNTWDARYQCRSKTTAPGANAQLTIASKAKCVESTRWRYISYCVPPETSPLSHLYTEHTILQQTRAQQLQGWPRMAQQSVMGPSDCAEILPGKQPSKHRQWRFKFGLSREANSFAYEYQVHNGGRTGNVENLTKIALCFDCRHNIHHQVQHNNNIRLIVSFRGQPGHNTTTKVKSC